MALLHAEVDEIDGGVGDGDLTAAQSVDKEKQQSQEDVRHPLSSYLLGRQ